MSRPLRRLVKILFSANQRKGANRLTRLASAVFVRAKKSPYHEDTGVPELLLPRCANGNKSDWRDAGWFPDYSIRFSANFRRAELVGE
jgi:hypothetical protein